VAPDQSTSRLGGWEGYEVERDWPSFERVSRGV
jgi:hypothetical protein